MILERELIRKIARGQKVEHRVPLRWNTTHNIPHGCDYTVNRSYPVRWRDEERAQHPAGRIVVLSITASTLGHVDEAAARREGYDDLTAFKAAWTVKQFNPNRRVWVLRIKPDDQAPPRLLAAKSEYGYVSSPARAMRGEGVEAPPAAAVEEYAKENAQRFKNDLEAERERRKRLPVSEQLARTLEDAKARGTDVSGDLRVIQRRIDAMKRKADAA